MSQDRVWSLTHTVSRGHSLAARPPRLSDLALILVRSGTGMLLSSSQPCAIAGGSVLLLHPHGEAHFKDEGALTLEELRIAPSLLGACGLELRDLPQGLLAVDLVRNRNLSSLLRLVEQEQAQGGIAAAAVASSMAIRFLASLAGPLGAEPNPPTDKAKYEGDSRRRVEAYARDLKHEFIQAKNLDTAAESLGLSRRRFTQIFRQCTNTSWLSFVRHLRIEHAKGLLLQPEKTVLSIAFECGFEDLSTFYRAFKRELGMSPNEWRQRG